MTEDEARSVIREVLRSVAPEADLDQVGNNEDMREALDLDSIDLLNLMVGIHERTGIEIPERDYAKLATLDGCISYLTGLAELGA